MLLCVVFEYGYILCVLLISVRVVFLLRLFIDIVSLIVILKLFLIGLIDILELMWVFVGNLIFVWLVINFNVLIK